MQPANAYDHTYMTTAVSVSRKIRSVRLILPCLHCKKGGISRLH